MLIANFDFHDYVAHILVILPQKFDKFTSHNLKHSKYGIQLNAFSKACCQVTDHIVSIFH